MANIASFTVLMNYFWALIIRNAVMPSLSLLHSNLSEGSLILSDIIYDISEYFLSNKFCKHDKQTSTQQMYKIIFPVVNVTDNIYGI